MRILSNPKLTKIIKYHLFENYRPQFGFHLNAPKVTDFFPYDKDFIAQLVIILTKKWHSIFRILIFFISVCPLKHLLINLILLEIFDRKNTLLVRGKALLIMFYFKSFRCANIVLYILVGCGILKLESYSCHVPF